MVVKRAADAWRFNSLDLLTHLRENEPEITRESVYPGGKSQIVEITFPGELDNGFLINREILRTLEQRDMFCNQLLVTLNLANGEAGVFWKLENSSGDPEELGFVEEPPFSTDIPSPKVASVLDHRTHNRSEPLVRALDTSLAYLLNGDPEGTDVDEGSAHVSLPEEAVPLITEVHEQVQRYVGLARSGIV